MRSTALSLVPISFILLGLLVLGALFQESLFFENRFSLSAYRIVFLRRETWELFFFSLFLASVVSMLATFLGTTLGFLFVRTDLPGGSLALFLFSAPFLLPPYFWALAETALLSHCGCLFGLLKGFWGTVWVLTLSLIAVPLLLSALSFKNIESELEEAALLHSGPSEAFRRIVLPLSFPGLFLAWALVFLFAFGEFTVPQYFHLRVFPVISLAEFSAFYRFEVATAASAPMLLISALIFRTELGILRFPTAPQRLSGKPPKIYSLGRIRWIAAVVVWGFWGIGVGLPFGALILSAGGPENYLRALIRSVEALQMSLLLSFVSATLLLLLGAALAGAYKSKVLFSRMAFSLSLFLLGLPGTVLALGLTALFNRPLLSSFYTSGLILFIGYALRYTAVSARLVKAGLTRIPSTLADSALLFSGSRLRRLLKIHLPLLRPVLIGTWGVSFLLVLRDTTLTMVIYPPGRETVPVRLFTLLANTPFSEIAALAVFFSALSLFGALILWLKFFCEWFVYRP